MGNVEFTLYMVIGLIIGLIVHEFFHAWAAHIMGDDTAKRAGRLTLDPMAHIDPIGTVALPLVLIIMSLMGMGSWIIGYAKPVPVNPMYFRKRWGEIFVSLAGVTANITIAIICLVAVRLILIGDPGAGFVVKLIDTLVVVAYINVLLFVFNLIPIPPLDGSRIVSYFLKGEARMTYNSIEPYGFMIILILIMMFSPVLREVVRGLLNLLAAIVGLPKIF